VRATELSPAVPGSGPGARDPSPGGHPGAQWQRNPDTARVLRISPTTVVAVLKKVPTLQHVNPALLPPPRPRADTVRVRPKRAAEVDEMWSFVGAKATERWL